MTPQTERAQSESTFRRYGLPLLVHDHSARRDVFGRAAPRWPWSTPTGIRYAALLEWDGEVDDRGALDAQSG